jgi:glycine cleavage system H lipoate-binding protein
MNAGILPHMMCNRNFDCACCPLDAALRMQFDEAFNVLRMMENEKDTTSKYLFTKSHCWIQRREAGLTRVGLEPMMVSLLPMLKTVVLPSEGDQVFHTHSTFWIVTEGGTFSLPSPINGQVVSHNQLVTDHPAELLLHPLTRGWLYELSPASALISAADFFDDTEAFRLYKSDFSELRELIRRDITNVYAHVGPTQADGGVVHKTVQSMLGPKRYFELFQSTFVKGLS